MFLFHFGFLDFLFLIFILRAGMFWCGVFVLFCFVSARGEFYTGTSLETKSVGTDFKILKAFFLYLHGIISLSFSNIIS